MIARRPRAVALWAALLGAVLALSGCLGLPRSSDVQPGRKVNEQVDQRTRVVVNGPSKGASQDVIARDFVRSGASFQETDQNNQVVGRAFLAPASVDRWKPTSAVTVYDEPTAMAIEHLPADQVRLTVSAVATIDAAGRYTELAPGTKQSVVFSMERIDGEWRIDLPAQGFGLWINTDDFSRAFSYYPIHYVVPKTRRLVSDVRWLPSGSRVVTAVARAQLSDVPDYLEGVVATDIPPSTRLAIDAVDVSSVGVATVTLSNGAQTLEPERRRGMWAQFVATLGNGNLPQVTSVTLAVQGIGIIAVPGLPDAISSLADLGYTQDDAPPRTGGMMRTAQGVELINPQMIPGTDTGTLVGSPLPGNVGVLPIPADYVDLALSPDGQDVAGVAKSRAELVRWRDGKILTVPSFGTALTNPGYDTQGRLWIAGRSDRLSAVWWLDASTTGVTGPKPVTAAWLTGRTIVQVAPSPDGTRLAVLSRAAAGGDDRLDIAGIQRNQGGEPVSLATPYQQGQPLVGLVDLTWIDTMTLAVLGRDLPTDVVRPFIVPIGQGVGLRRIGQLTLDQLLVRPVPGATGITSRGNPGGLIVMAGDGAQLRVGTTWITIPGVRSIIIAAS